MTKNEFIRTVSKTTTLTAEHVAHWVNNLLVVLEPKDSHDNAYALAHNRLTHYQTAFEGWPELTAEQRITLSEIFATWRDTL